MEKVRKQCEQHRTSQVDKVRFQQQQIIRQLDNITNYYRKLLCLCLESYKTKAYNNRTLRNISKMLRTTKWKQHSNLGDQNIEIAQNTYRI